MIDVASEGSCKIGESERLRHTLDGHNGTNSGTCEYPEKSMQ
jgi:hypothetical protein